MLEEYVKKVLEDYARKLLDEEGAISCPMSWENNSKLNYSCSFCISAMITLSSLSFTYCKQIAEHVNIFHTPPPN